MSAGQVQKAPRRRTSLPSRLPIIPITLFVRKPHLEVADLGQQLVTLGAAPGHIAVQVGQLQLAQSLTGQLRFGQGVANNCDGESVAQGQRMSRLSKVLGCGRVLQKVVHERLLHPASHASRLGRVLGCEGEPQ